MVKAFLKEVTEVSGLVGIDKEARAGSSCAGVSVRSMVEVSISIGCGTKTGATNGHQGFSS